MMMIMGVDVPDRFRFAMEGGDVDCRYEDAYERPWMVAMGGPDFSWAEPGLGANPLNYTLAFCDIIGKLGQRSLSTYVFVAFCGITDGSRKHLAEPATLERTTLAFTEIPL